MCSFCFVWKIPVIIKFLSRPPVTHLLWLGHKRFTGQAQYYRFVKSLEFLFPLSFLLFFGPSLNFQLNRDPRQRMLHEKQEKKLSTGLKSIYLLGNFPPNSHATISNGACWRCCITLPIVFFPIDLSFRPLYFFSLRETTRWSKAQLQGEDEAFCSRGKILWEIRFLVWKDIILLISGWREYPKGQG